MSSPSELVPLEQLSLTHLGPQEVICPCRNTQGGLITMPGSEFIVLAYSVFFWALSHLGHIILLSNLFREALIVLPLYFSLMFPFPPKQSLFWSFGGPQLSLLLSVMPSTPPLSQCARWVITPQGCTDLEERGDCSWKRKPLYWFHASQEH